MSAYNPPIRNLTIFDTLLFREANDGGGSDITIAFLNNNYLKFPTAQGAETLQQTTINGDLTLNQNRIHLGNDSQSINPPPDGIAIGEKAGYDTQSQDAIAIGAYSGEISQSGDAVAIGWTSGQTNQGTASTAIGAGSGSITQGSYAVALGYLTGENTQGLYAVAIGSEAGKTTQGSNAVALGYLTGQTNQGSNATALGHNAGNNNQGTGAVAIGHNAGEGLTTGQGNQSVAIGLSSGRTSQGANCVAVGHNAGNSGQGNNSIAIGHNSGTTNLAANSIQINATGTTITQATASSCVIAPIRTAVPPIPTGLTGNDFYVFYNDTTKELYKTSFAFTGSSTGTNLGLTGTFVGNIRTISTLPVGTWLVSWAVSNTNLANLTFFSIQIQLGTSTPTTFAGVPNNPAAFTAVIPATSFSSTVVWAQQALGIIQNSSASNNLYLCGRAVATGGSLNAVDFSMRAERIR